MSDGPPGAQLPSPPPAQAAELYILLACFAGTRRATAIRRQLDQTLRRGGDTVLDQVIVKVNAKQKAMIYDPQRTLAGILTPALTWGVFGLLAGGLQAAAVWAPLGAVCGGLYAYLFEHQLTKSGLHRIGHHLPAQSSAIVVFVRGPDPQQALSAVASVQPATATAASIAADLSAVVYGQDVPPTRTVPTPVRAPRTVAADEPAVLSMVLVRFVGEHTARQVLRQIPSRRPDENATQVELLVEANRNGRRTVTNPATGSAAFSKTDAISWGAFGLVWGAILGFAGGGGILATLENGLVIGILWTIFGVGAGALYGMWAGRGLSARRLKSVGPLVPADSSLLLAWSEGPLNQATPSPLVAGAERQLVLGFTPVPEGAVLAVAP